MQESFRQETGPYRKRRKMHSTDVFISHVGLDKLLIALPIWEKLQARGLNCFLDSMSLQPGDDGPDELAKALESAKVGVFILSPEFAARKWTMRELRCFLRRRSEAIGSGMRPPILIPVFYRLGIRECRELDPDRYWDGEGRNIFEVARFFSEERQREANTDTVKRELKELADISGVENDEEATNLRKDEFSHLARAHFVERVFRSVKNKLEKDSSDEVRDGADGPFEEEAGRSDAIGDVRQHVHSLVLSVVPKSYDTLTRTFSVIPHRHKNAQIFSTDVGAVNVNYFTINRIEAMNRQGIDIAEYLRNAILRVLENNFHNDRVLMSNILNNISVMYFNELQASSSIPQLRKMGRELLEQAIGICNECDKARANLALLLWRGHDRTGDEAEISRVIKLLEEAISIRPLPKHRVLLARVLISADSGLLCDWDRAKELLYDAIREDLFGPAEELLADMLTHEREGVPPDVSGANRLRSLPLYSRVNSKEKADTLQRVGFQDSQEYVETKLKEAKAKQSQIFLLVLGGGARGKTSLVRSLRRMSFVSQYNPTELAALSRIPVLLGSQKMSAEDVDELAHERDSVIAILSQQAISSPNTLIRKPTTVEKRNQNPAPSIPYAHSKGEHATIDDERTSSINLAPQTGNTSQSSNVTMNRLLARLGNDLENSATPKEIDGTLVQCWDLAGQSQYVMAHVLFVKNGSLFVFVVNLKNLLNISTRVEEVRELCGWMQLVHALVPNSKFVRPIIVGTHKDCCGDWKKAEDVLLKGLKDEVGTAVYDDWVRARPKEENGTGCTISFIAVENKTALEDPGESGIKELEELIKQLSDDIVISRRPIPLWWIAFVEEVERKSAEMNAERMSTVVWNIQEIFKCVDGFPAFSTKNEERHEDALRALKYFSKLGRVVLFEISGKELYLFPRPVAMLDFVRRVTGPEECVRGRLSQRHARLLDKGLLTKEGLKELWHGHSQETCEVMLKVLCDVDLLIQVQDVYDDIPADPEELFAIPALLPKAGRWLQCRRASGESELRLVTEFVDAFPPGLMGSLISRLHKGVGRARTNVKLLASDAAILTSKLSLKDTGRVMVSFVSQKRHIEWKVLARDPVSVAKRCLIDVEAFSSMPLRGKRFRMKHYLKTQCRSDLNRCGGEWTASFRLPADWVKSGTEKGLPNLEGECTGTDCEEAWRLWQLMPEMEKYHGPARPEALRALTVIQRTSKEVGMKAVDVFISHAGPDKWTIASPLFDKLRGEGFSCFFDKKSMTAGDCASEEMIAAMESAKIGVFILSPEFAAKRWPMKELRCFLRRRRDAQSSGATLPILIPVFYRLSISECRSFKPEQYVDENGSNLFEAEKFYTEERQKEATMAMVKDELVEITKTTGIENLEAASNDDVLDTLAFGFRKRLVRRIVHSVKEAREAGQQQEAKGVGIPSTSTAANR